MADEPVSMLDVSVRAGILNLLRAARDELDLAAIYISHDLALIRYVCERTIVMYLGRVVEEGPTADLIAAPMHPYTRALVAAVPVPRVNQDRAALPIRGSVTEAPETMKAARSVPDVRTPLLAAARKIRRCARSHLVAAPPAIYSHAHERRDQACGASSIARGKQAALAETRVMGYAAMLPTRLQPAAPRCRTWLRAQLAPLQTGIFGNGCARRHR